jgi:hypothetical protein
VLINFVVTFERSGQKISKIPDDIILFWHSRKVTNQKMSNNDETIPDDIMDIDVEGIFLSCIVGTKLMLSNENSWSGNRDPLVSGNLVKRVSIWHKYSLTPAMKDISEKHEVPLFAKQVVQEFLKGNPHPVSLHIHLLCNASKHIEIQCEQGVGLNTSRRVKKWIKMMKKTKESVLFDNASEEVKTKFSQSLQRLDWSVRNGPRTEEEHPFFNHEVLFIKVAHMVYFYVRSNEDKRIPHTIYATVTVDEREMGIWENLSGILLEKILKTNSHVLGVTDESTVAILPFTHIIELPYQELKEEIMENRIPAVDKLHKCVMTAMCSALQKITVEYDLQLVDQLEDQLNDLRDLFATAHANNEYAKKVSNNREKNRRSDLRKQNKQRTYTPRDPTFFQRDIFIMGNLSAYYKVCTPIGRAAKLFRIG